MPTSNAEELGLFLKCTVIGRGVFGPCACCQGMAPTAPTEQHQRCVKNLQYFYRGFVPDFFHVGKPLMSTSSSPRSILLHRIYRGRGGQAIPEIQIKFIRYLNEQYAM